MTRATVCVCAMPISNLNYSPLFSLVYIYIYVLKNSFLLDLRVNLSYMLVMLFHTEISLENYMSHCVCVYELQKFRLHRAQLRIATALRTKAPRVCDGIYDDDDEGL